MLTVLPSTNVVELISPLLEIFERVFKAVLIIVIELSVLSVLIVCVTLLITVMVVLILMIIIYVVVVITVDPSDFCKLVVPLEKVIKVPSVVVSVLIIVKVDKDAIISAIIASSLAAASEPAFGVPAIKSSKSFLASLFYASGSFFF